MSTVIISGDDVIATACEDVLTADGMTTETVERLAPSVAAHVTRLVVIAPLPFDFLRGPRADHVAWLSTVNDALELVVPHMVEKRYGRIVVVVPAMGQPGVGMLSEAVPAVWGAIGIARKLARQVAPMGITSNVVRVGMIDHPEVQAATAEDPELAEAFRKEIQDLPVKRLVRPDEVASAVAFLLSDGASYTNGIVLPVDCGFSIGSGA